MINMMTNSRHSYIEHIETVFLQKTSNHFIQILTMLPLGPGNPGIPDIPGGPGGPEGPG